MYSIVFRCIDAVVFSRGDITTELRQYGFKNDWITFGSFVIFESQDMGRLICASPPELSCLAILVSEILML